MSDPIHLSFWCGPATPTHAWIRWWSRTNVSHVEVVAPGPAPADGATRDCVGATAKEGGVARRDRTFGAGHWIHVTVPWADAPAAWDRAVAEVGRPYDMWGLFGSHFANARRHAAGRWFCSELAAHAVGLASPQDFSPGQLLLRLREMNDVWDRAREVGAMGGRDPAAELERLRTAPPGDRRA